MKVRYKRRYLMSLTLAAGIYKGGWTGGTSYSTVLPSGRWLHVIAYHN